MWLFAKSPSLGALASEVMRTQWLASYFLSTMPSAGFKDKGPQPHMKPTVGQVQVDVGFTPVLVSAGISNMEKCQEITVKVQLINLPSSHFYIVI